MRFDITTHAIGQWRMRAAQYANAKVDEIEEAVQKAIKIENEPLPFKKENGLHYYYLEDAKAYFIVRQISLDVCKVITVIIPGLPLTFLLPKTKRDRLAKEVTEDYIEELEEEESKAEESKAEESKAEESKAEESFDFNKTPEPEFRDVGEKYQWLKVEYVRLCELLADCKNNKIKKSNLSPLKEYTSEIQNRIVDIKPAYSKYKQMGIEYSRYNNYYFAR